MDTSEFDKRIEGVGASMDALRNEMESVRVTLADSIADFAREWFDERAESAVTANPERAKELGVDGLRTLKQEVETLKADVPAAVDEFFGAGIEWAHRAKKKWDESDRWSNPYRAMSEHRQADIFDHPLRQVLGTLAPLLMERGLSSADNWQSKGRYSRSPYFPYNVEWSDDMKAAAKRYADLYQSLVETYFEREEAISAKARAEAEDLWRQA